MSSPTLDRRRCREVDRRAIEEYGIPGILLMENAGRGTADTICGLGLPGPVVICCGRGNNGGDGFVIARHLDLRGIDVQVLVWGNVNDFSDDAGTNLRIIRRAGLPVELCGNDFSDELLQKWLASAGTIVDALLGTGASGEPRPPLDRVIRSLNAARAPIVAVDVPSGLDCDTGEAAGVAVRAAHTCTFVALKPGFLAEGAAHYTGQVHVLDIGAPRQLIAEVASL